LDGFHLTRSEKGFAVGQKGEFIGIVCDVHRGVFLLAERKEAKIMASLLLVVVSEFLSSREVAKVRGKLVNYGQCMEGLRPFSVPFTLFIGAPESEFQWDERRALPSSLREHAAYLREVVPRLARAGAPIWPLEPATVFDRWQRGLPLPFKLVVVTYDAAVFGLAVSICLRPGEILRFAGRSFDRVSTVITFEDTPEHQVHREGWAGSIALETAIAAVGPGPSAVLLRKHCSPALGALERGSSKSPVLQEASLDVHRQCHRAGWSLVLLHVRGERLIEEGVDDGSRAGAKSVWGPKCSEALRAYIGRLRDAQGIVLTIDFFASGCNALTPRYASWTQEPGSEAVDAFSMRSWESSMCPTCGCRHMETGFFFPPSGLEERVVSRARSDGARGLFLVPTRHRAGFWLALRRAATSWTYVNEAVCKFEHTERELGAHTLFLVDFGGLADSGEPCASAGL